MSLYQQVIDQNRDLDTLLDGWIRDRVLAPKDIREAKRLRSVIAKIRRIALQVISRASPIAETGPLKPPAILRDVPLADLPVMAAALDLQISTTLEDVALLEQAMVVRLPMFTREHLDKRLAEFHEALRLLQALTPQIAQWRSYQLTPAQRRQVTTIAKQQKLIQTLLQSSLRLTQILSHKTFDPGTEGHSPTMTRLLEEFIEP